MCAARLGRTPRHDLPRTISLLVAAGLPEPDAFAAATARPATVFGLAGEIGTLAPAPAPTSRCCGRRTASGRRCGPSAAAKWKPRRPRSLDAPAARSSPPQPGQCGRIEKATISEIQNQLRAMARRLLRLRSLRAADALQLAAAAIAAEHEPRSLDFVCLDERLAAAASREGFRLMPTGWSGSGIAFRPAPGRSPAAMAWHLRTG